jgi:hypothetical protein
MNLKLEEIARELNGFVTGRIRPGQLRRRLNGLADRLEDPQPDDLSGRFDDGSGEDSSRGDVSANDAKLGDGKLGDGGAGDFGLEPPRHVSSELSEQEQTASRSRAVALTALELLDVLLTPAFPRLADESLKAICSLFEQRLRRGDMAVARRCVPYILRELGHLRLYAVGNPLMASERSFDASPGYEEHWIDVGLLRSLQAAPNGQDIHLEETIAMIPFSVFTAEFFYGDLPDVLDEELGRDGEPTAPSGMPPLWRDDEFYYHPENDQAIPLLERHPQLRDQAPTFQYFVGTTGLAEIVLDVPRIGRRALRFAAQLFCLRNGVRRATLDGRLVAGAPRTPPR